MVAFVDLVLSARLYRLHGVTYWAGIYDGDSVVWRMRRHDGGLYLD